jgi:hypothetical protein
MGMGETYGGTRWGSPPPTRVIMGDIEKAVAGYNGGDRPQRGFIWR